MYHNNGNSASEHIIGVGRGGEGGGGAGGQAPNNLRGEPKYPSPQ